MTPDATEELIIGEGEHRYAVDHGWATLPEGRRFGYTHGIVQSPRNGRTYIANQSADAVAVFDSEGAFLTSWGAAYAAGAHGLTLAEEGGDERLYLANSDLGHVVKTTLDGEVLWKRGAPAGRADLYGDEAGDAGVRPGGENSDDDSKERLYKPTETAVAPDGTVYVADGYGQHWVHRYTPAGEYRDSFGGPGAAPHHLDTPHGISIDDRAGEPVVQIADRSNVRIVNFTLDGQFIETVAGADALRHPCTTAHAGGRMYVPDLFARVSIFGLGGDKIIDLGDYVDGQSLTSWDDFGSPAFPELDGYPDVTPEQQRPGKFVAPHDLCVDAGGNIYVVEWHRHGRVTKLTRV
jgi:DNA-binding beta-propeller fold protein YncE